MNKNAKLILTTGFLVLTADLATKWLVQARFAMHESVPIVPGVALTYVMNPGAAFSMFAGWPAEIRLPLFLAVTLGALWAVWHYWKGLKDSDTLSALALGLIVGGALGNLVDRVRYHEVVDFIEIGVRGVYTWPVFNLADSAVCVGVTLLFCRTLRPLNTPGSET